MAMLGAKCHECCDCPECNHGTIVRLDCKHPANTVQVHFTIEKDPGDPDPITLNASSSSLSLPDSKQLPCSGVGYDISGKLSGNRVQQYDEKRFKCNETLVEVKVDLPIGFTASPYCFGSGVSGYANSFSKSGPITKATLTSAGSGYAQIGRREPTLSLANTYATPAVLEIDFTKSTDECGLHYFVVESLSVVTPGDGYIDGDALVLTASDGDVVSDAATGTIHTTRTEPTITASTTSGSGLTFTITIAQIQSDPPLWTIESVEETASGPTTEYINENLQFTGPGLVAASPASVYLITERVEPTVAIAIETVSGSGAVISPVLQSTETEDPYWFVADFNITDSGEGYAEGDPYTVVVTDGQEFLQASGWVGGVDENGGIVGLYISSEGAYVKSTGVFKSLAFFSGGEYYRDDGIIESISLTHGGAYYRPDEDLPPYVQSVAGLVRGFGSPHPPPQPDLAIVTGVVNANPKSPTFGQVTKLQIADAGDNYQDIIEEVETLPYEVFKIGVPDDEKFYNYEPIFDSRGCVIGRRHLVGFNSLRVGFLFYEQNEQDQWVVSPDDIQNFGFNVDVSIPFEDCAQGSGSALFDDPDAWGFQSVTDGVPAPGVLGGGNTPIPCYAELRQFLAGASGKKLKATVTGSPCSCGSCEFKLDGEDVCYSPVSQAECASRNGVWNPKGDCLNPLP